MDAPSVKISGFGTGAMTWTDTDRAQFARATQPAGAGESPRTGVDSNLGLQVDARINDWLSLTGQGLVRKAGEDDYGADVTLAFAKFKLSNEISLRAGRMGLAVFMISDYRNVGYANTFVRPPQEVYSQIPLDTVDGADVTWQRNVGETTVTTQLAYGRTLGTPTGGGRITVDGHSVLSVLVEHGPFSVHFGRDDGKLAIDTLWFHVPSTKVSFTEIGFGADWNNVVLQSEYARNRGMGNGTNSWYALGGYRIGKVLPYYAHASVSGDTKQRTDSVGVRWDAFQSAAIKFQLDHVRPEGDGLFVNVKPGFHGPVNVGTVAVDFVF